MKKQKKVRGTLILQLLCVFSISKQFRLTDISDWPEDHWGQIYGAGSCDDTALRATAIACDRSTYVSSHFL